jgi:hypothetical protein
VPDRLEGRFTALSERHITGPYVERLAVDVDREASIHHVPEVIFCVVDVQWGAHLSIRSLFDEAVRTAGFLTGCLGERQSTEHVEPPPFDGPANER